MSRLKIAFFYSIYPVKGGGTVHGYHLAKALYEQDCELLTTGNKTPFVTNYKRTIFNWIRIISASDLVYIRLPSLVKPGSRLIVRIARLLGKKIVGELDGPLDELQFQAYDKKQIKAAEKKLASFIQQFNHVITVSQVMRTYITQYLDYDKISVIPNGGELPGETKQGESKEAKAFFKKLRKTYKNILIWSGTDYPWHGFEVLTFLIEGVSQDHAFIIVSDAEEVIRKFSERDNVFVFHRMPREQLQQYIALSDTGLVIYGDYSWARTGFYGSSLKFHEYLCAGLQVVTNKPPEITSPQVFYSEKEADLIDFINKYKPQKHDGTSCRTWYNVAGETMGVLEDLMGHAPPAPEGAD